jgi:hypothetical protein
MLSRCDKRCSLVSSVPPRIRPFNRVNNISDSQGRSLTDASTARSGYRSGALFELPLLVFSNIRLLLDLPTEYPIFGGLNGCAEPLGCRTLFESKGKTQHDTQSRARPITSGAFFLISRSRCLSLSSMPVCLSLHAFCG